MNATAKHALIVGKYDLGKESAARLLGPNTHYGSEGKHSA